jgi:hypothetical protein
MDQPARPRQRSPRGPAAFRHFAEAHHEPRIEQHFALHLQLHLQPHHPLHHFHHYFCASIIAAAELSFE